MLMAINWNVSPEIFPDTVIPVRWYGLLFASAFLIGFELLKRMFKSEGHPVEWTDKALIYTMVGCLVGARLGHVFFYDWQYYLQRPTEIIMFWKGGLASHGAAIGIILAFAFVFLDKVFGVLAEKSSAPPLLAVWTPNIVFGILAIYLLRNAKR